MENCNVTVFPLTVAALGVYAVFTLFIDLTFKLKLDAAAVVALRALS